MWQAYLNDNRFAFDKGFARLDEWYDGDTDEIIEYYCGHCLACGKSFQWERHYKFDHQTPYVED